MRSSNTIPRGKAIVLFSVGQDRVREYF